SGALTVIANESPEADATTEGTADGFAGIGASVSTVTVTPTVTAYIDTGSQVNAGTVNVNAIAKPVTSALLPTYNITAADTTNDTITVSNHNLQTGDVIEYQNGGTNIGGLSTTYVDEGGVTNARQYGVLNVLISGAVDPNRIALGA